MTLNDRFKPYIEHWRVLEPRERRIVAMGATVTLALLAYLLVWSPLSASLDRLRRIVPRDRGRLVVMRREMAMVHQIRLSAPKAAGGSLMSLIGRSATVAGLRQEIVRMQPSGRHAARVVFDRVDFNTLVAWLASLQQRGIHVRRASINRRRGPGEVSASLMLAEPHA